jgi:hypothetical protein
MLCALGFRDALDRANGRALRLVKVAFALDTYFGIDYIIVIVFADCLNGTLGLAGSASDAFVGVDFHCHIYFLQVKFGFLTLCLTYHRDQAVSMARMD